ncbi:MAG: signal peptidase I [Bacillales bacterium]|jgi:signal peptidase I|nr:signal peptidase I [Bacillales bacterium]
MKEVKKKNKRLNALFYTVIGLIVSATVFVILSAIISVSQNGIPSLLGHTYLVVQSESMLPEYQVHDLVINKKVPFNSLKEGDDITFKCEDKSQIIFGEPITHRIWEINGTEIVTYGINNKNIDGEYILDSFPVTIKNYIGKVIGTNKIIGQIASVFTGNSSFVLVIVGVGFFAFIVMSQTKNILQIKREEKKEKDRALIMEELRQEVLLSREFEKIQEEEEELAQKKLK